MSKILVLLLILFCPLCAWAGNTYYVSNANPVGSDRNNGTSPSTPWLTLQKVNNSSFSPGDTILFNRGCVWRGQLTVPSSGSAGAPITFGDYGSGAQPVINGASIVSSWSQYSGKIWQASVATQPGEVWIDNTPLYAPQSAVANLGSQNQWFWSGGKLYIYSAANPSTGHTVEAAQYNFAVYINSVNYITVQNMEFLHTNNHMAYLRATHDDTLNHILMHDNAYDGIHTWVSGGNHTIKNCTIYNTGEGYTTTAAGCGIHFQETTQPSLVEGCRIYYTGMTITPGVHDVYDESGGNTYYGNWFGPVGDNGWEVKVDTNNTKFYYNVFTNAKTCALGIDESGYSNLTVYNNTFFNCGIASPYAAINIMNSGGETGYVIKNNIFYLSTNTYSTAISLGAASGLTSDYNLLYGPGLYWGQYGSKAYQTLSQWQSATNQDAHSLSSDPLFVSTSTPDLHLQAGSPAIKAGHNVGLTTDYAGDTVGSVPDMGAYQFVTPLASPTGLRLIK